MRQKLLIVVLIAAALSALGAAAARASLPVLLGASVFFIALGVSFVRGVEALYLIAISVMFSPEIATGMQTGRATGEGAAGITLRFEDLILLAVGLGWLLRTAYQNRRFGIIRTPLNTPIVVYMAVSIIATLLGALSGGLNLLPGIVHNLKYFEYFFIFFMILAHVRDSEIIARIIRLSLLMFFFAVLYGYTQIDPTGVGRVCAPFDAEPNTFGGYMVLMMCIAFGIIQTSVNPATIIPLALLLLLAVPPFLFTLSRASYMAAVTGLAAFLAFSPRRIAVAVILIGMIAAALLGVQVLPEKVYNRIAGTFQEQREYLVRVGGVSLDSSASARIVSYGRAIEVWETSPLLGKGVTGTHFIDSQYFRLLAETGIIGLGVFLLILFRLLTEMRTIYKRSEDSFLKGATLGFFCGIFALMAHALSANTFIIVRIAEPFWILAGLLLLLPHLPIAQGNPADEA